MFSSDIPEVVDDLIIQCVNDGDSPDAIARQLRDNGTSATAGQVRARLRYLGLPVHEEEIDLEREVWASLAANLSDLSEIEGRLRDLDELAFDEAAPTSYRVAQTQKNLTARAGLILSKHKLLQQALTERAKRKLLEAQLPAEQRHPPVVPTPAALPPAPPPPPALPEAMPQTPLASLLPAAEKVPA